MKKGMGKEEIINYVKKNEMDIQNAPCSVFIEHHVFRSYVESDKVTGILFSPMFAYHLHGNDFTQIMPKKFVNSLAERTFNEAMKDVKSYDKIISTCLKFEKAIDDVWRANYPIDKLSDKKLIECFNKISELDDKWWHYAVVGEDKGSFGESKLIAELVNKHKLSQSEAMHIASIMTHPENGSIFNKERKDFCKICVSLGESKDVSEIVTRYIEKYFYSKSNFVNMIRLRAEDLVVDAEKEIKEKGVDNIMSEINKMNEEILNIKNEKERINTELKFTEKERKMIDFVSKAVQWADYRKRGMMKQFYYIYSILHELAERKNVSFHNLTLMTHYEIESFMKGNKMIDNDEIKRREKSLFIVYKKGCKEDMFYGEDADMMFDLIISKEKIKGSINGSVASRGNGGIVRGVVNIVKNPSKDNFNLGEILVTSMTRIEFVPLMKKARAIITDEGGIASHAAIVSRELGVPCIIGTKNATRLLRNGDEIELDMNKGIVKVIKKK